MKKIIFKIVYWIISLTWGLLMSFIGLFACAIALLFYQGRFYKNGCSYIVVVGGNWGGISLGCFSLCGNYDLTNPAYFEFTRQHEFGHSIQNLIFGPLFPFVVAIPSACRYWYKRIMESKGKKFPATWYYDVWFESTATTWGLYWTKELEVN